MLLLLGIDGGNDDTGGDSDCNTSTGNGGGQFSKKQRKARYDMLRFTKVKIMLS